MMEIKHWQDMTEEEREADLKRPYNSFTLRSIFKANNNRMFVDQQIQDKWKNHYGMTVKELIVQLAGYHPDQPVVLRMNSSWNFVSSEDVGVKPGLVLPDLDEDGEECRANIIAGKTPSMEVVCLYAEGYNPKTVDPYEAQEYMEESE